MSLFELLTRPGKVKLRHYVRDTPIILGEGMLVKREGVWKQEMDLGTRHGDMITDKKLPDETAGPYNVLSNADATLVDTILRDEGAEFDQIITEREDSNAIFGLAYSGNRKRDVGVMVQVVKCQDDHGNEFIGYGHPAAMSYNDVVANFDLRVNSSKLKEFERQEALNVARGIVGASHPEGYFFINQGLEIATYWACELQTQTDSVIPIAIVGTAYALINGVQAMKRVFYRVAADPTLEKQIKEVWGEIIDTHIEDIPLVGNDAMEFLREKYTT